MQKTPTEITAITGASGPYPLITVTPKRLFYSGAVDRGNLWMMRIE